MGDSGFLPKEGWRENKGAKHRMGKLGNGLGSAWKRSEALPDSLPAIDLKQSHLHKAELAISKLSWKTICLLQIKQSLHGLYEGLRINRTNASLQMAFPALLSESHIWQNLRRAGHCYTYFACIAFLEKLRNTHSMLKS